jgi:uroporphyrinogen-III synthase
MYKPNRREDKVMKLGVNNNLSLKYFPTLNAKVRAQDSVNKKFLLKCSWLVKESEDILLTNNIQNSDIVLDAKYSFQYKKSILFSANKEDLIEYTSLYDEVFDIYPVDSLEFKSVDFVADDDCVWVVFTSKRAVDFFFDRVNSRFFCFKKIAAVGEKTAQHLAKKGFKMDYVPDEFYGESLVEFLKDKEKVLIVSPAKYNKAFDELKNVRVMPVYENVVSKNLMFYKYDREFDFGLFSSPSAFWHIKEAFGSYDFAKKIKRIIAIGKTTKSYIESCGFKAEMPNKATIQEMFNYIEEGV